MKRVGLVVLYLLLGLVLVIPLGTLATAEDTSWSVSVDVTCNINSVSATFGMNPAASAGFGYDNGLDQVGPPAPPEGQEAYFWHSTNTPDYAKKLTTSLVAPAAEVVWPFRVNYVKMGPADSDVTVSWNTAAIPSGYTVTLRDMTATTVTDMVSASSYTFHIAYDESKSSLMYPLQITATLGVPGTTPPTVTSSSATAIGATSATLNGNLGNLGTASPVQVSFEYGESTSYGSTTPDEAMTANGTFNATVSGLTPATTYHFRAKAVGDGTAYGDDLTFATPSLTAPSVITNDASEITSNSAQLNGELTTLGNAASVTAWFVWGATSGSYPNETTGRVMTGTGTFSFDLGSLTAGTTYFYRAKAMGQSEFIHGDEKSFATGQAPEIESVDPGSGKRKQHLTVTISGSNLDRATMVSFGSGITVEDYSVKSSTQITAEITIDADAAKGRRDVSVTTGSGAGTKIDGFSVVGGRGGICSGGAGVTPGVPSEMTTTLAALGLLFGVGYWLVRRQLRNSGNGVQP